MSHCSVSSASGPGQPGTAPGHGSRRRRGPRGNVRAWPSLPVFTEMAARVRNWGRWGPDDEIGTLNLIDDGGPAAGGGGRGLGAGLRAGAAPVGGGGDPAGVRRGPGEPDPHHGPGQRARSTRTEPDWVCFSEDVLTMATQCATHWDALAHASYGGVIYNGYPASTVSAEGAARCGIHRLGTVVSRGVLLDVARALGRRRARARLPDHARRPRRRRARWPASPSSRATSCWCGPARWCTCSPERRDLVAYTWPSPGLTIETAEWFHAPRRRRGGHRHPGLRGLPVPVRGRLPARPPAAPGGDGPDPGPELGARRARRRTAPTTVATRFLLDATPLPLTQGLGSPLNPVALK